MRNKKSLNALQNLCNYIGGPHVTKNMQMIEIGCFTGESTEVWCKNFGRVIAIDPWDLLKKDYYINTKCPYGDGQSSIKILKLLKNEK